MILTRVSGTYLASNYSTDGKLLSTRELRDLPELEHGDVLEQRRGIVRWKSTFVLPCGRVLCLISGSETPKIVTLASPILHISTLHEDASELLICMEQGAALLKWGRISPVELDANLSYVQGTLIGENRAVLVSGSGEGRMMEWKGDLVRCIGNFDSKTPTCIAVVRTNDSDQFAVFGAQGQASVFGWDACRTPIQPRPSERE